MTDRKFRFTKKQLETIPKPSSRTRYYDEAIEGLIVDVSPNHVISFYPTTKFIRMYWMTAKKSFLSLLYLYVYSIDTRVFNVDILSFYKHESFNQDILQI